MDLGLNRTIRDQANRESQVHLTNASLSFQEVLKVKSDTALKINQINVYNDYMHFVKKECILVSFKSTSAKKYAYKPKSLAYSFYGNTELYTLILRLNHIYSVSEFTEEKLMGGLIIPTTGIISLLDEVLIKEKNPINRNLVEVNKDINNLK